MQSYSIITSLPFCLHLKDDKYEICYKEKIYTIQTKKFWTQFAEESDYIEEYSDAPKIPISFRFSTPVFSGMPENFVEKYKGKNIEFENDDTDHFRKTVVEIKWDTDIDYIEKGKAEKAFQNILEVFNHFIEIYRMVSGEYYLPLLKEVPFRSVAVLRNTETGKSKVIYSLNLTKAGYNFAKTQHDEFKEKLRSLTQLDSTTLSLNAAKHLFSNSQYRNAILETVIALEPVVERTVKKMWSNKGLSKAKISDQLKKIDLNFMMTVEIPNMLDLKESKMKQMYDNAINAINLRNKIVHLNFTEVSKVDATNAIDSIDQLIKTLNEFLQESST